MIVGVLKEIKEHEYRVALTPFGAERLVGKGHQVLICVANMPGVVGLTSTLALTNATFPYILTLADNGLKKAVAENPGLREGVNLHLGQVVHPAIATTFDTGLSEFQS